MYVLFIIRRKCTSRFEYSIAKSVKFLEIFKNN